VNPAEISLFSRAAKEWADRNVLPGFRMTHLHGNNISKVFCLDQDTVYLCIVLHERDKPAQDISPPLRYPDIYIGYRRGNTGAEDTATESALLTRLI
jgi:hypothetical protein